MDKRLRLIAFLFPGIIGIVPKIPRLQELPIHAAQFFGFGVKLCKRRVGMPICENKRNTELNQAMNR